MKIHSTTEIYFPDPESCIGYRIPKRPNVEGQIRWQCMCNSMDFGLSDHPSEVVCNQCGTVQVGMTVIWHI